MPVTQQPQTGSRHYGLPLAASVRRDPAVSAPACCSFLHLAHRSGPGWPSAWTTSALAVVRWQRFFDPIGLVDAHGMYGEPEVGDSTTSLVASTVAAQEVVFFFFDLVGLGWLVPSSSCSLSRLRCLS